jgi:TIR domain
VKIFLSYGHDRNTPIVQRIKDDLEAAGHSIWIDGSQIKVGDDWRRSIVDGLKNTDWTMSFLSRHSVRDPGVCLDEPAIALHLKAGAIATVLLEAEAATQTPVSISGIQWIDMHDWADRLANKDEIGDQWYREQLNEILAVLADPKNQRFAGEI